MPKLTIEYDVTSWPDKVTSDIIKLLETTLPYMVDNIRCTFTYEDEELPEDLPLD